MTRIFLRGLFAIIPIAVTIYFVLWILRTLERVVGGWMVELLPESWRVPGLGLVISLFIIYLVGLLLYYPFTRLIFSWLELPFKRVPFLKLVYTSIQDLTQFFKREAQPNQSQAVLVKWNGGEQSIVGLVTRTDLSDLPLKLDGDHVAVFFPLSYSFGGYTMFVPKAWITPIPMRVEEVMKHVVTGWMSSAPKV